MVTTLLNKHTKFGPKFFKGLLSYHILGVGVIFRRTLYRPTGLHVGLSLYFIGLAQG